MKHVSLGFIFAHLLWLSNGCTSPVTLPNVLSKATTSALAANTAPLVPPNALSKPTETTPATSASASPVSIAQMVDLQLVGYWRRKNFIVVPQNNETYADFKKRVLTSFQKDGSLPEMPYQTDKNGYGDDFDFSREGLATLTNARELYQYVMHVKIQDNTIIQLSQQENHGRLGNPMTWEKVSEKNNLNAIMAYISPKKDVLLEIQDEENKTLNKAYLLPENLMGFSISVYRRIPQ